MEDQVRQAQKMESIGLLAGGVAHDFNNLLQVIQAHAALARRPAVDAEARDTHLRNVLDAADRAGRLTRQLLAFSRRQPLKLEATDLADLVGRHLAMVRRVIGEDVTVELSAQPDLDQVRCDRTQIEQVLLNLCVNARDAMPDGGQLTLSLENVTMGEAYVAANPWARAGRYVALSVADTGRGMDAATRERIFEPFFTTKGSGTGLGLAVVYGVVRQHSGLLRVYSEPGQGTTFKVYLPSVGRPAGSEKEAPREPAPGGHETILLAEDDAQVAAVTRGILESAGYAVQVAADGAEAVRLFHARPEAFDLLLFDLVMPIRSGREARDEIRRHRPAMPVLFCSGYDPQDGRALGRSTEVGDPVIAKPYDPDALLRRVREVLDGRTPP
jgi:CheY-like chemotaxis protein